MQVSAKRARRQTRLHEPSYIQQLQMTIYLLLE